MAQITQGVMLVNTGTPAKPTPGATRKYLRKFLSDSRIVPLNKVLWFFILRLFVLPGRGKKSAAKYQKIWTQAGSPFTLAHTRLVQNLNDAFVDEGLGVCAKVAYLYSEPSVKETMASFEKMGITSLVVLPLYPQSAYSTTMAVRDQVEKAVKKLNYSIPITFIDNYHDNPAYVKAIAGSIKYAGFDPRSNDRVLFSYHSIPLNDIRKGDTYELQADSSALQIASELDMERYNWTIGFQCRFDKRRTWLSPYTKEVLARWAEGGEGRIFFVCPNFAVDCLETLYDIEYELKPYFVEACKAFEYHFDMKDFVVVPCLNASRAHVKVLLDVLRPYVH